MTTICLYFPDKPHSFSPDRVLHNIASRRERDMERARAAAARVRAAGGKEIDAQCAAVRAGADEASVHSDFKKRVLRAIQLGTGHPAIRARYGARLNMLRGFSTSAAVFMVDVWLMREKHAYGIAVALGEHPSRLSLEILRELQLLLRLARRSEFRDHLPGILDFVLGGEMLEAAE